MRSALVLVFVASPGLLHGAVLGVPKSQHSLFEGPSFSCDGGRELPISTVNDDYCDCNDGSDEPGTSACSGRGGRFYCVNKLYRGQWIPSSRVGDGVCDCCDGSDEPSGVCINNCDAVGAAYREELREQMRQQQAGGAIKRTYIEQGKEALDNLAAEALTLDQMVTEAQAKVDQLNSELTAIKAEEEAKAATVKSDLLAARIAGLRLEELEAPALRKLVVNIVQLFTKKHAEVMDSMKIDAGGVKMDVENALENIKTLEEEAEACDADLAAAKKDIEALNRAATEAAAAGEGVGTAAEAAEGEAATEGERKSKAYRTPVTKHRAERLEEKLEAAASEEGKSALVKEVVEEPIAELFGPASAATTTESEASVAEVSADGEVVMDEGLNEIGGEDDYSGEEVDNSGERVAWVTEEMVETGVSGVVGEKENEVRDAETTLREAKKSAEESREELEMDFGSDNEYWVLKGDCFSVKSDGYEYEMCPYGKAQQDGKTNLGVWKGWDPESGRTVMLPVDALLRNLAPFS